MQGKICQKNIQSIVTNFRTRISNFRYMTMSWKICCTIRCIKKVNQKKIIKFILKMRITHEQTSSEISLPQWLAIQDEQKNWQKFWTFFNTCYIELKVSTKDGINFYQNKSEKKDTKKLRFLIRGYLNKALDKMNSTEIKYTSIATSQFSSTFLLQTLDSQNVYQRTSIFVMKKVFSTILCFIFIKK